MRIYCCLFLALFGSLSASTNFISELFKSYGVHSNPDVFCIIEHCNKQSLACAEDANCRANLICAQGCGFTNFSCLYECINTYEDDVYDDFMKCMVDDYHCLKMVSPDPSFRCEHPPVFLKSFNISALNGKWYIPYGLNPLYDCINCTMSSYAPTPRSKNLTLTVKYDAIMINGSTRHRVSTQQVEQTNTAFGGLLDFTDRKLGITMYEKWQIVEFTPRYALIYYCGHVTSDWWYEGSLVYSRTPTISSDDMPTIVSSVTNKLGYNFDKYCHLQTEDCGYKI